MQDTSAKNSADSDHGEVLEQALDREQPKVDALRQTPTETSKRNLSPEKVAKRLRGTGSIFQNGINVW